MTADGVVAVILVALAAVTVLYLFAALIFPERF